MNTPYERLSPQRQAYNLVTGLAVLGIIGSLAVVHRIAYHMGLAESKRLS